MRFPAEPFKIKVVESIKMTTLEERIKFLEEAGNNLFSIPADTIFVDLLTDSGTSAMSDRQWAGMMTGDEAYAGSRSFYRFEETIKKITGFNHVIPTHQGRVAENLLFSLIANENTVIPSNSHFDTTRANIEFHKGTALDLVIDEAYQPELELPFKGNMDLKKLEAVVKQYGKERIPVCMLTITNNSGGGQPVSMENIRNVKNLLKPFGIPLFLDACRFAENAYFIKTREKGYENKSIMEIANEMFSYADGCTMSAKKDGLVNIGGFLALNDTELSRRITNYLILIEGFPTYGGLAGRDLEAISIGIMEALDENYLAYRTNQVKYLADLLTGAGISVIRPAGGHAVYIDARKFYPNIKPEEFPGQALVVELYKQFGIRGVEVGSLMFGKKDEVTGKEILPRLDLVRLAIPRRVYTTMHMNYVAEGLIELFTNRDSVRGLRIIYEAPVLRHFTARLEISGDK
ncbi:MAG: tryptophanase [Bacteroidetes bacterium]|nr:tryptophanase [Bacteroidota bacterium]